MTVESERRAMAASLTARDVRREVRQRQHEERHAVVCFIDAALEAGWVWDRIGKELDITSTAARRYYDRNRRRTHGGDI